MIAVDDEFRHAVEDDVRDANVSIIEGTGASRLGIGVVAAARAELMDLTDARSAKEGY